MSFLPTSSPVFQEAIRRLEASGLENPLLEAQLLLAHALGVSRLDLLRGLTAPPTEVEWQRFERLVRQREQRFPLAYLRGTQEFYGLPFSVSPSVLIPRPETELLVEFALTLLQEELGDVSHPLLIDVGTGSGCIAIASAAHLLRLRVLALDRSAEALWLAQRNADALGVADHVQFAVCDLLECAASQTAHVIVSNPPYIPTEEIASLQAEVRDYEPRAALDGGMDGFDFHNRLLPSARRVLKPGGALGIEVAQGQASFLAERMKQAGFVDVTQRRDLAGIERIVTGRLP
jgi:release factor glutamine methyltransferase